MYASVVHKSDPRPYHDERNVANDDDGSQRTSVRAPRGRRTCRHARLRRLAEAREAAAARTDRPGRRPRRNAAMRRPWRPPGRGGARNRHQVRRRQERRRWRREIVRFARRNGGAKSVETMDARAAAPDVEPWRPSCRKAQTSHPQTMQSRKPRRWKGCRWKHVPW